jgi:hypothetical protein
VGILATFLLIWSWAVIVLVWGSKGPNGMGMGTDYSHTYAAIVALRHGLNAYDYHVLWTVQASILRPLHLPVQPQTPAVLVGTTPFFLWLFQPLTWMPYQISATLYMLLSYALSGAGFLCVLKYFGWRRRVLPTALFLAAPQTILAAYFGNTVDIVFLGIALSLPLLKRYPLFAGACLSLSVLKMPAAAPIALLILLFEAPEKRRVIWGFVGCYAFRSAVAAAALGWQPMSGHLRALLSFSQSIDLQPNLVSLSGSYVRNVGHGGRMSLELAAIALACALTGWWYLRSRHEPQPPILGAGWLWGVWLLATPYAHFVDEMILVIPLVALLGRDGEHVSEWRSIAALYLGAGSIFLFSAQPHGVALLWLPLLGLTLCFAGAGPLARKRNEMPAPVQSAAELPTGLASTEPVLRPFPFPINARMASHKISMMDATTDS